MINQTAVLLSPSEDYSNHILAKHVKASMGGGHPFDLYCIEPLQKVFSNIIVYDYVKRMTEIGVKTVNKEIIDLVRKEHPKYVIWPSVMYEFLESTAALIRQEGNIVVGIFFDDASRFDEYSKYWIPHLDYCVTHTIEAVPKYRELGARVIHTLGCHSIPLARDWSSIEEKYTVSFVGKRKFDRAQYINEIQERNLPVALFGLGWERYGGRYVPFEEMLDIFKTSKINLNFSRTHYNKLEWKGKLLQICTAGGFLLTEYVPGIENYFDMDKEIVCFHDAEEMIEKITYYLAHDEERRAIARAGWERATGEYTPFHMHSRIFGEIEKDLAARGRQTNVQPQAVKMPIQMRKRFSDYYFRWGMALAVENYQGLWKDSVELSISYNPFNIGAWLYHIVGFLPSFMRPALFRLYKSYTESKKLYKRLRNKTLYWADSAPYLKDLKRSIARRYYHT